MDAGDSSGRSHRTAGSDATQRRGALVDPCPTRPPTVAGRPGNDGAGSLGPARQPRWQPSCRLLYATAPRPGSASPLSLPRPGSLPATAPYHATEMPLTNKSLAPAVGAVCCPVAKALQAPVSTRRRAPSTFITNFRSSSF